MSSANIMIVCVLYGSQYDYLPIRHELVSFYNRGGVFTAIYDISLSIQFRLNSLGPCWDGSVFEKILKSVFGLLHENLTHTSPKMVKSLSKFFIILPSKHKIQPKCSTSFLRCLFPTAHFSTCYRLSFRKLRIFPVYIYQDKRALPANLQIRNFLFPL
jgi:hypothetical protein